jgi:hypothetical protein
MSLSKNRKVDSECRIFQEKWTGKYFCFYESEAFCSICSESIAVFKEYNIARHYNSKHKDKYKKTMFVFWEKKKWRL